MCVCVLMLKKRARAEGYGGGNAKERWTMGILLVYGERRWFGFCTRSSHGSLLIRRVAFTRTNFFVGPFGK